jgi:peptidoglycan/LPS O-acetylase OafA/YrhL
MERLRFIDGLRGIAASMVVLCHLVGRTDAAWLTKSGYLGVAIFFVLSGFVIAMSIGDRRISLSFLGRFAARRAIRLDPPYWASIFLVIALAVFTGKQTPSVQAFFSHLLYTQELLGFPAILSVYWTLCLEIQFYLFLILMLWIGQTLRAFWVLWALVFALSLIEQAGLADLTARGVFLPYWFAFALGAMTYWVTVKRLAPWALLVAIIWTLAAAQFSHADWFIAASLTSGLIYFASLKGKMSTWLSGWTAQFLGETSYSLYLFHPIIGWAAMTVALKFANQWVALAVGIIASVLSAWLVNITVERYSIRLSRMVSLSRPLLREQTP